MKFENLRKKLIEENQMKSVEKFRHSGTLTGRITRSEPDIQELRPRGSPPVGSLLFADFAELEKRVAACLDSQTAMAKAMRKALVSKD